MDGFRGVGRAGEDSFGFVGWGDGGRGLGVNIARESSSSAASAAPRTRNMAVRLRDIVFCELCPAKVAVDKFSVQFREWNAQRKPICSISHDPRPTAHPLPLGRLGMWLCFLSSVRNTVSRLLCPLRKPSRVEQHGPRYYKGIVDWHGQGRHYDCGYDAYSFLVTD